jgi:hypothetical protein
MTLRQPSKAQVSGRIATRRDTAAEALEAKLRALVAGPPSSPRIADWKFTCTAELVLRAGRPYYSEALTAAERAAVKTAITRFRTLGPFEFKHCYYNAQALTWSGHELGLVYVEGYLMPGARGWPILHGWTTINEKVIDPTLTTLEMITSGRQEPSIVMGTFRNRAYWGVPLDRKYVMDRSGMDRPFQSVLDDWQWDFPLLRKGVGRARARVGLRRRL